MKNANVVFDIYCKAVEKDYNNFLEDFLLKEIMEQSSKGFAYIKIFYYFCTKYAEKDALSYYRMVRSPCRVRLSDI